MPDPWTYAKTSEHSHQAALFQWSNMACRFGLKAADDPKSYTVPGWAMTNPSPPIPQLKWLHAIHNQGHGDAIRGAKAKAEGVKPGVFDLFLPVPMGEYSGLYLELKVGKGQPSDKQLEFADDMRANGYACELAYGWLEAREKILEYLSR